MVRGSRTEARRKLERKMQWEDHELRWTQETGQAAKRESCS